MYHTSVLPAGIPSYADTLSEASTYDVTYV
jgi:hypothetical protein